jgi:hypothetical protein
MATVVVKVAVEAKDRAPLATLKALLIGRSLRDPTTPLLASSMGFLSFASSWKGRPSLSVKNAVAVD